MSGFSAHHPRRVLIASASPLFAQGLQKLFQHRWGKTTTVVGMTSTIEATFQAIETLHPDLVIVDSDDTGIHREEFLNRFISGVGPLKIMLVSLRDAGVVVVYDRRTLSPLQAEDWLDIS